MTSQINPNDIDGNYPIAGVSNNTQGMRDNFTNTRTNFQYASDEITDLQSKALLKAALTGTTLDNNLANNVMYNAQIRGFSGTTVAIANTSGTINIDCNAGHYQSIYMAGNISLGFDSNTWPTAGTAGMVRTQITVDQAGRTMALPVAVSNGVTGIQGFSSNVITFAQAGTYEFGFLTTTGGSNITMFDLNRPLSYYTNDVTMLGNLSVSGSIGLTNISVGNVTASGNVLAGNLNAAGLSLSSNVVSVLNVTGNINGGNLRTPGVISATGNIDGGNLRTTGLVTVTGNIDGGNLRTAGQVSATGNITGGNINTGILSLSGNVVSVFNVTANIAGGNISTPGLFSATGNIDGGNLRTVGQVSATGNITSDGQIRSSSNLLGIGYTTGAGSSVVQATSRTTGVTINAICGSIQLFTAAGSPFLQTFQVTNNRVTTGDVILLTTHNGLNNYVFWVNNLYAGGFFISFYAPSGTSVDIPVINFAVIRSVTS